MEFVCYTNCDHLPQSADALFAEAEKDSVFFSRSWFTLLMNHAVKEGKYAVLACVIDAGRVVAILPLLKRDGEHWRSLDHLYSSLYTLLLAQNRRPEILDCLVRGLDQLPAHSLRLDPVAEDDGRMQDLREALESSGYLCHRYFRFYNWVHPVRHQSFDDYMAARPARVRNTIARKQRKLEREHEYAIQLYTNNDLQRAMADYSAVYDSSWKATEQFQPFIDSLTDSLSQRGWLRLAVLYIDDKPAAAQYWFVVHRTASVFKLAYDESWKRYSPGSILIRYLIKHAIEIDKVDEIDFLSGNDAYKQEWMSERRERWAFYFAKPLQRKNAANRIIEIFRRLQARTMRAASGRRLPLS